MGWEVIENVKPSGKPDAVPPAGVRVASRGCLGGKRYIALIVGRDLARSMGMAVEHYPVRLMFGSGSDAGKIAVGGTVLDPFGGAGTTGLVAEKLQRNAVLIELSEDYAELARERLRAQLVRVECSAVRAQHSAGPLFDWQAA